MPRKFKVEWKRLRMQGRILQYRRLMQKMRVKLEV